MSLARQLMLIGLLAGITGCSVENVNDFRRAAGMPSLPAVRICREKPSGYDHQDVVRACTSQIEHGGLSGVDLGVAYTNRGVANLELDNLKSSRSDLHRAVDILDSEVARNSTDAAHFLDIALYNRAFLNALLGDRDTALEDFERSREAFTHFDKSRLYAVLGDYPIAVEEFEKAAKMNENGLVKPTQEYLKRKGFYLGAIDGQFHPDLVVAYESCARNLDCLRGR